MAASRVTARTSDAALVNVAALVQLCKLQLSLLVAVAAGAAHVARSAALEMGMWATTAAVLLLSAGAAALNAIQDRDLDARFSRTRNRPLPSQRVAPTTAAALAATLIVAGTLSLAVLTGSWLVPASGLVSVLLYNGIYTPLKRVTVLSAVPGAAAGAMPVLIGWTAAGGSALDPALWALMTVLAVWQLPHFWLVLLDNRAEVGPSGLPTMLRLFTSEQLGRLTVTWVAVFAVLTLLLPLFDLVTSGPLLIVLLANAALVTATFARALLFTLRRRASAGYRALFGSLNLAAAVMLLTVVLQPLLTGG
jgi:protoheme IX farnesyltransferase